MVNHLKNVFSSNGARRARRYRRGRGCDRQRESRKRGATAHVGHRLACSYRSLARRTNCASRRRRVCTTLRHYRFFFFFLFFFSLFVSFTPFAVSVDRVCPYRFVVFISISICAHMRVDVSQTLPVIII